MLYCFGLQKETPKDIFAPYNPTSPTCLILYSSKVLKTTVLGTQTSHYTQYYYNKWLQLEWIIVKCFMFFDTLYRWIIWRSKVRLVADHGNIAYFPVFFFQPYPCLSLVFLHQLNVFTIQCHVLINLKRPVSSEDRILKEKSKLCLQNSTFLFSMRSIQ